MVILMFTLQCRLSTYVWLVLGYPLLAVVHFLAIFLSWMLVFTIPVSKMNVRTLSIILLMPPEEVIIWTVKKVSIILLFTLVDHLFFMLMVAMFSFLQPQGCETRVLLCCYRAFNWYYYKFTVDGINVFAVSILCLWVFIKLAHIKWYLFYL